MLPCKPPPIKRLSDFRLESARPEISMPLTTGSASRSPSAAAENEKASADSSKSAERRSVLLAAVQQNGNALLLAPSELRNDPALVAAAVAQNGYALQYASAALQNDANLVAKAMEQIAGNVKLTACLMVRLTTAHSGASPSLHPAPSDAQTAR